jgi:hypothetical protein
MTTWRHHANGGAEFGEPREHGVRGTGLLKVFDVSPNGLPCHTIAGAIVGAKAPRLYEEVEPAAVAASVLVDGGFGPLYRCTLATIE